MKYNCWKRLLAWLGIFITLGFFIYFTVSVFQSLSQPAKLADSVLSIDDVSRINWIEVVIMLIAGVVILYLIKKEDK